MKQGVNHLFGQHLKKLRMERGLTQQALSELADVDYKHIQRLEGANPTDIKLTTLEKLSKAFDMPVWKLLKF